jgi:hydroxymethylpyrimidine kinase/phosphomethylpyrimidine kinase
MASFHKPSVCLSIAGLDPSGGAGVLADVKTFSAFGCYGAAAVTSLTFQNTVGVFGVENQSGETVRRQIEPIFEDLHVDAIKTGMLPTAEVIGTVAAIVKRMAPVQPLVVDPVVRSTSGFDLIDDRALRSLIEELFPLATVVSPNVAEAERITGIKIASLEDVTTAGAKIRELGANAVLIKGGHLPLNGLSVDHLFTLSVVEAFESEYVETTATHGTGCTLAAAITANMALGKELSDAVRSAKRFVTEAIRSAPMLGHGHSPVNHFAEV